MREIRGGMVGSALIGEFNALGLRAARPAAAGSAVAAMAAARS
jgi:hypothetical protein